eukprot:CAMPEP_0196589976 /NCGR_PEP_ID=MMETSP1081-20130531/65158_1 /TAXON_ID=36882 /ORGANISM="Pyramimonas amylifera, Strain CCMP720" /LENGTH=39 /DNA_ID= /DNA_START= /DNA_END= /DNA_ORIENTATION=
MSARVRVSPAVGSMNFSINAASSSVISNSPATSSVSENS